MLRGEEEGGDWPCPCRIRKALGEGQGGGLVGKILKEEEVFAWQGKENSAADAS